MIPPFLQRKQEYRFFDTADDKDPFKKAWRLGKISFCPALLGGVISENIYMFTTPSPTRIGYLGRYALNFTTWGGASLGYTAAVFCSANIRGKDDSWNHFWGGLSAAAVMGAIRSDPRYMFWAIAFIPFGCTWKAYKKYLGDEPIYLLPTQNIDIMSHTHEFDVRKNTLQKLYEDKNEEFYRQRENHQ